MSEANKLYQVNGEDAFKDAEPYYFGNKMPPTGLFRPLPTDDNPSTSENEQEWYQEGQLNGFSVNAPLDGYRHNGAKLSYVKKGTFPKAGVRQQRYLYGNAGDNGSGQEGKDYGWTKTYEAKIYLEGDNHDKLIIHDGTHRDISYLFDNLNIMPTRIGILLVGAGGGSGGLTWYDPDKNGKKSDQYVVSGSGGGGGGLLWGVLNLENTDADNYFKVVVGASGAAGINAERKNLKKKKPKYGANGSAGGDTKLYWHQKGSKKDILIAVAGGGMGGSQGNFQTYAVGGDGGACSCSLHDYFVYCDSKQGGKGCSCHTDPEPYISAWGVSIKFAQTEDPNYITTINHSQVSAVFSGDVSVAHKVPGGHSYSPGNTFVNGANNEGSNGSDWAIAYGRGGAGGDWSNISERGAPGCFILYY